MYFKGVYSNSNGHLPDALGRIWYEADINYYEGRRNKHRVLWSNDGLIFVTYDHYETFYEIVQEITMEEKKIIILDLTDCKYLGELHERIRVAFDFPEWYGANLSAFDDLLWTECDAEELIIIGENTLPKEFERILFQIHRILDKKVKQTQEDHMLYEDIKPFSYRIED